MGGCASKPKDLDIRPEAVPTEAPATAEVPAVADAPKAEDGAVVAQENVKDVVETQPEVPLVDLSEPKEVVVEELAAEAKSAEVEVVSELIAAAPAPAEETVEAKEEETKKESEKEVKEVEVTPVVEAEKKDDTPAAASAPSSDDKSDATLVTV